MSLQNIYDLTYEELNNFIINNCSTDLKKSGMRTNQLWKFIYKKGLKDILHFSNIPDELKNNLKQQLSFKRIDIAEKKNF